MPFLTCAACGCNVFVRIGSSIPDSCRACAAPLSGRDQEPRLSGRGPAGPWLLEPRSAPNPETGTWSVILPRRVRHKRCLMSPFSPSTVAEYPGSDDPAD